MAGGSSGKGTSDGVKNEIADTVSVIRKVAVKS